jgi:hypothetical protein
LRAELQQAHISKQTSSDDVLATYKTEATLSSKIRQLQEENSTLKLRQESEVSTQDFEKVQLKQQLFDMTQQFKQAEAQLQVLKHRLSVVEAKSDKPTPSADTAQAEQELCELRQ